MRDSVVLFLCFAVQLVLDAFHVVPACLKWKSVLQNSLSAHFFAFHHIICS